MICKSCFGNFDWTTDALGKRLVVIEPRNETREIGVAEIFLVPDRNDGADDGNVPDLVDDDRQSLAKDIDLVVSQTGVDRGTAEAALFAHNGDIVSAIMAVTE